MKAENKKFTPEQVAIKNGIHDEYVLFFMKHTKTNIKPNFTMLDWKKIKEITLFFSDMCKGDCALAINTWKAILENWENYEPFYKNNISLRFIHSNINNYIFQYGKSKNKQQQFGKANKQNSDNGWSNITDFGSDGGIQEWC
jgi:hypothetical protein